MKTNLSKKRNPKKDRVEPLKPIQSLIKHTDYRLKETKFIKVDGKEIY